MYDAVMSWAKCMFYFFHITFHFTVTHKSFRYLFELLKTTMTGQNGEMMNDDENQNEGPKRHPQCLLGHRYVFFVIIYHFTNEVLGTIYPHNS